MLPYHGQFNPKGLPIIEIEVVGNEKSEKVWAVIDTGYTGYLSITYPIASRAKLKRIGVESANLANGDSVSYLECVGTIVLGDVRLKTVIDVQEKGRILLGMAFLRDTRLCFKCDASHSLAEIDRLTRH